MIRHERLSLKRRNGSREKEEKENYSFSKWELMVILCKSIVEEISFVEKKLYRKFFAKKYLHYSKK